MATDHCRGIELRVTTGQRRQPQRRGRADGLVGTPELRPADKWQRQKGSLFGIHRLCLLEHVAGQ